MTASEVLDIKFDCLSHKKQFYTESTSSCLFQLNSPPSERNEDQFTKYEQDSCGKDQLRNTCRRKFNPNMPREIDNTSVTAYWSV